MKGEGTHPGYLSYDIVEKGSLGKKKLKKFILAGVPENINC